MRTPELHRLMLPNAEGNSSCHQNARRLVVVGTSGAGKTTIARQIASILDVPHIELDSYRYGPNWTKTPDDVVRDRLSEALRAEAWVADGNYYRMARDVVWPRANTVAMARLLDPRGHVEAILQNDAPRDPSAKSYGTATEKGSGGTSCRRDSLFLWALKTHWSRRRTMPAAFARPEHAHLDVAHLRSHEVYKRVVGDPRPVTAHADEEVWK